VDAWASVEISLAVRTANSTGLGADQ